MSMVSEFVKKKKQLDKDLTELINLKIAKFEDETGACVKDLTVLTVLFVKGQTVGGKTTYKLFDAATNIHLFGE